MANEKFNIQDGVLVQNGYEGDAGDIVIPDGVTCIASWAFNAYMFRGKSIRSITIPKSVVKIERAPWVGVEPDTIIIEDGNSVFTYKDGVLFNEVEHKMVYVHSGLTSISWRKDLLEIGAEAFYGYLDVKELSLPSGVKKIGDKAFTLTSSGNVVRVNLPDALEELGDYAFSEWTDPKLEFSIDSLEHWYSLNIGGVLIRSYDLLINGELLTDITVTNEMGKGTRGPFYKCASIKNVTRGPFYKCASIKNVTIEEGITEVGEYAFAGMENLQSISLPDSLEIIGKRAFDGDEALVSINFPKNLKRIEDSAFNGCEKLSDIELPEQLEYVGESAFNSCSLDKITITKNVVEIGKDAFSGGYRSWSSEARDLQWFEVDKENRNYYSSNGALVKRQGEDNILVCIPAGYASENFVVSDEITSVDENALQTYIETMYFPKNFKPAGKMFEHCSIPNITFEKGFLCKPVKVPTFCTGAIDDPMSCAYAVIYQSGKTWEEAISEYIGNHNAEFNDILSGVINVLSGDVKERNIKKAVKFALHYVDLPSPDVFKKLYALLFDNKSKNLKLLIEDIQAQKILLDGKLSAEEQETKTVYAHPIEEIVNKYWRTSETTRKLSAIITEGVPYADAEGVSSPEAVMFVVSTYADQMDGHPNYYSEYKTSYVHTKPDEIADSVVAGLDKSSLQSLLEELAYNKRYQKDGYLLPFGRYASPAQISALNSNMRDWENWSRYGAIGRKNVIIARGALMLSDTREAMMAIDKVNALGYYASVRGTDADTLRDTVLADFGFNKDGKKVYDLGGNTVSVSLEKDLSLRIFDDNAGKIVKSIPKKGADAELHEKAKKDFADLKKNIKRVVTNRKNLLFEAFLTGKTYVPSNWGKSYLENPVLNAIACCIVWKQNDKYFTVTQSGKTIACSGEAFTLTEGEPIAVAHPIEMSEGEIEQWQKYFVDNNLKQPFEQVWEPAYKETDIKSDRYKGCSISVYKFSGKEQHGIKAWGLTSYSEEFGFSLVDCELKAASNTWRFIPGITDDAKYELGEFTIKQFSRYANHIVFLLDRWTIEERIIKNDPTIGNILGGFTVAQLLEFISLASEKNSTDCLAVLLEYKNRKFSEYDPMMEFTLD